MYTIIYYSGSKNSWYIITLQIYRYSVVLTQTSSILFLVNMYSSSYNSMCLKIASVSNPIQILTEYRTLTAAYKGFKTGIGPILLFHYFYSVLYMMQFGFILMSDTRSTILYFLLMTYTLILLWNLSVSCQNCFEHRQDTRITLRQIMFNI